MRALDELIRERDILNKQLVLAAGTNQKQEDVVKVRQQQAVLLTTHFSLFATHFSLLTTHHSPLAAHYSLLRAHHLLLTAHHPLLTAQVHENTRRNLEQEIAGNSTTWTTPSSRALRRQYTDYATDHRLRD